MEIATDSTDRGEGYHQQECGQRESHERCQRSRGPSEAQAYIGGRLKAVEPGIDWHNATPSANASSDCHFFLVMIGSLL